VNGFRDKAKGRARRRDAVKTGQEDKQPMERQSVQKKEPQPNKDFKQPASGAARCDISIGR
jgi:hypothetical protein